MSKWKTLNIFLIELSQEIVLFDRNSNEKEELEQIWRNHIFGISGLKSLSKKLTRDEVFFSNVFHGFIEIYKSFSSLCDIEIYIRSFPYRNTNIKKSSYLRYHIENYYSEIYIFKERLLSYLTTIG